LYEFSEFSLLITLHASSSTLRFFSHQPMGKINIGQLYITKFKFTFLAAVSSGKHHTKTILSVYFAVFDTGCINFSVNVSLKAFHFCIQRKGNDFHFQNQKMLRFLSEFPLKLIPQRGTLFITYMIHPHCL